MSDFLNELNATQRQAVVEVNGPVMVLAGAGSGKTRVLTYRIAHLINSGTDSFNILALTFTNKASKEMRSRIEKLIGSDAKNLWMGTFHSVFAKILRMEAKALGFPNNFTIYDTEDSKSLLKSIVKEKLLNKDVYKPAMLYSRISSLKNKFISVTQYLNDENYRIEDRNANRPHFGDVYREYVQRCFRAGAMDFDDILLKTNELFEKSPDILNKYQHKFKYILVDEYQDTNHVQYLIVKKLASVNRNLCVVGDDAQSIYAFRGANIQNILYFERDYPELKVFKLEQNYRSTKTIVAAAAKVIKHNKEQFPKEVWTDNDEGDKIKIYKAANDSEEGRIVASSIFEQKMNDKVANKDFAILYRTNSQSRAFEEQLRKMNLNYRIVGGLSFYQRKEIKDLLAYCRLAINPKDEEALKRVINYPARGIGKTSFDKIVEISLAKEQGLWEVLQNIKSIGIGGAVGNKISAFVSLITSYQSQLNELNAYQLGLEIAKTSGILKILYEDKSIEGISRYDNLQELLSAFQEFSENTENEDVSLPAFMQDVALLTDADTHNDDDDKITLMTIHGAKGLEFPYVYIVGLEENLFPSQMSLQSRAELEEERRLFYVALTRAERKVTLSYAQQRYRWGQITYAEPSRFLDELDSSFLEMQAGSAISISENNKITPEQINKTISRFNQRKPTPPEDIVSFEPDDYNLFQEGMKVEHARFGIGSIETIEGRGEQKKATILFNDFGQKLILLKFAKLRIK